MLLYRLCKAAGDLEGGSELKLRYFGLLLSGVTYSGSAAAMVWFYLQPMGVNFATGFVPYVILSAGMTVYWLHRILISRHLFPGECECGHVRSVHDNGTGECCISHGISDKFPEGSSCACQIFILKTAEPKPNSKKDAEVQKLKKMAGL